MKLFWWLLPGLRLKRYVFEIILGLFFLAAAVLFFSVWFQGDTVGEYESINLARLSVYFSIACTIISLLLLYFGMLGLARSVVRILRTSGVSGPFKDLALAASRREIGPRVVAFGGGTGMKSLLRGLKDHTGRISAVITMADDGGSSGRLRHELGALPPGDIRNCLVALSNSGPNIEKLFQYRFEGDELGGHSFGNLFITALHRITGDFRESVRQAGHILAIAGEVLPSTTDRVGLVAHHEDGTVTTGQSAIQTSGRRIIRVELKPRPTDVHKDITRAIHDADIIIFGPGSLYTSIIPNLLVPGMIDAVRASYATKVYICNVLTQVGETESLDAVEHVKALESHCGGRIFDIILLNTGRREIPAYRSSQRFVQGDPAILRAMGYEVVEEDVLGDDLLHDPVKVAKAVMEIVNAKVHEETRI
ncbi:MAG: uridine diphosphate-N-acetylglucosamine-binding protein YvcK [Candidatus Brocadiia bacterium]